MSTFKTRRGASATESRPPVIDGNADDIEGVTIAVMAAFAARVGQRGVTVAQHERIAVELGFPAGRYDLIRNAWLIRIYSSPASGKQFGTALDEARQKLA